MDAVRQAIEQALDKATLDPTPENVKAYIALQNQVSDRASRFAQVWQAVLLQAPGLDYSIAHPTNQIGQQVYSDQKRHAEDAAIHQLAQHSGLFFFYRSTCPYCQRFAPIVRDFTDKYHIPIVPITTDGIALPSFPRSQVDDGQSAKFGVQVEPALFTVDPYTHQAVPVSYGLTTEDELRSRILAIANAKEGSA
jgi:conjugal transfer pilus assembly protein TraF